jgi:Cd2+/Zn2+-exporting ATPase
MRQEGLEERKRFMVSGICCATEEHMLRKSLDTTIGNERYTFSLLSSELRVDAGISDDKVLHGLHRAGFQGRLKQELRAPQSFLEQHGQAAWTIAAGVLAAAGIAADATGASTLLSHILLLAAIIVGGWQILLKAVAAVRTRTLDMNALMTLAVIGAVSINRWSEGAAVIVLFSVALMLESYSASRTRRAIESLMTLSPQQVTVLRHGSELTLAASGVQPGDLLRIRPGERIPIDGVVVEGRTDVNQAAITGESVPVGRMEGE